MIWQFSVDNSDLYVVEARGGQISLLKSEKGNTKVDDISGCCLKRYNISS